MLFTYKYIVTTNGDRVYDSGYWTGHSDKEEAIECAKRVEGYLWKVKRKGDNFSIKPVKVDRDEVDCSKCGKPTHEDEAACTHCGNLKDWVDRDA